MILFDFEAAFPSISQEYLIEVLRGIGIPAGWLSAVGPFYFNNHCSIKLKGRVFDGFAMSSGVRQGCPLSPLLFVLAADVLLRRLESQFPMCTTRAFADDIVMIVTDVWKLAGGILHTFREFASLSGMNLHLGKTVVVPLWVCGLHTICRRIRNDLPQWAGVKVDHSAVYLGVGIGPGRQVNFWDHAVLKYSQRAAKWQAVKAGLQYDIRIYNTFAISVLAYLWQFSEVPEKVFSQETTMLRQLAPGPDNWCSTCDYWISLCAH